VKNIGRRDFMLDFAVPSKEAHMMAMEMPRMLDHFLPRLEARWGMTPDDPPDAPKSSEAAKG